MKTSTFLFLLLSFLFLFSVFIGSGFLIWKNEFNDLVEDSSKLIHNSEEQFLTTSNIQGEEYSCFGSCFCNTEKERLSSTSVVRGISYSLIALTSLIAFRKANEVFEKQCEKELFDSCPSHLIKSEVEECTVSTTPEEKIKQQQKQKLKNNDGKNIRTYFCYGNCVNHKLTSEISREVSKDFDCRKLRREGKITVRRREWVQKSKRIPPVRKFALTARRKFARKYLKKYCVKKSLLKSATKFDEKYIKKTDGQLSVYEREIGFEFSACIGFGGSEESSANKNVFCRQIDPPPTGNTNNYNEKKFWERKKEWDDELLF